MAYAMTKPAVESQIAEVNSLLNNQSDNYSISDIQYLIDNLKDKITQLQILEQDLFKFLGIKDISELEERIRIANQGVRALSGYRMQREFLDSFDLAKAQEYSKIENMAQYILDNFIEKKVKDLEQNSLKRIMSNDEIISNFINFLSYGHHNFSSKGGYDTIGSRQDGINPQVMGKFLSRAQRDFFGNLISDGIPKELRSSFKSIGIDHNDGKIDMTNIAGSNSATTILSFQTLINNHTKASFLQGKNNANTLNNINNNVKQAIKNACKEADQTILDDCLNSILGSSNYTQQLMQLTSNAKKKQLGVADSYAALVGQSSLILEGLLGEIQALYYFRTILGSKASSVLWTGNNLSASWKKMHADLVLREAGRYLGIQVKNTNRNFTHDAEKLISFAEIPLDQILNKATKDPELKKVIELIFNMESFNIEYMREGTKAVQRDNEEFAPVRATILKLVDEITPCFLNVIEDFLYIQLKSNIPSDFGKMGNVLYLIGGIKPVLASSIINQLLKELDGLSHKVKSFQLHAKSYIEKVGKNNENQSFTIIDAINNGSKRGKYSKNRKTKLTSAFLFKG